MRHDNRLQGVTDQIQPGRNSGGQRG